jgi:ankyrin repeat protein
MSIKNIILLCAIMICTASLAAQDTSVLHDSLNISVPDTSYFKVGNTDYNLVESVIKNDAPIAQMLLDRGADPNASSAIGNSALIYAAEKGNMEIMKMLIDKGADMNASGYRKETPLFMTIFANNFQATKYLLEIGANPNIKDDLGVTPLMYAAATNQYQSADLLLFYEADKSVTDKDGNDPLLTSVTFQNIETSDVLLQNGLSPDVQDIHGNTPAIVATQHANIGILELLLDFNADVNIANNKNYTPLAYAVTFNDYSTSELLIKHNANVNHQVSPGKNIIELARISGNDSLMSLLKKEDADLLKRPDFSEFQFSWGNSFSTKDYFMQFRGALVDQKYGFFLQTGIDYRPILLKINTTINDTLYQFRERRIGWSHGLGKNFKIFETSDGMTLSAYAAVNGYLSFPGYLGSSLAPNVQYNIIPAAGVSFHGQYVGIKLGAEWYTFRTMAESGLKINISVFCKIVSPEKNYDRKEINWE